MYEEKMTKYLHLPIQILWFDANEIMLIVGLYILSVTFGGLMWIALFVLPIPIIKHSRKLQRGYFHHVLYSYGWINISGYPNPSAKLFYE